MAKHLSCNDVVPGCSYTVSAPTEEELLREAAEHTRTTHGVKEVTPELAAKVKEAIRG